MITCEEHDCIVVFDGRYCPVCEMEKDHNLKIEELEDRISDYQDDQHEMEMKIIDLENEVKELR